MIRTLYFLFLSMLIPLCQAAENKKNQDAKGLRVLCVGNSYTIGTRGILNKMAKQNPDLIHFDYAVGPGMTLKRHLANAKLIDKIKNGKYDVVVLQEQSQVPSLGGNFQKDFFESAKALDKHIKASGAKTAFFVTWGHRDGDKRNKQINPTYEAMQKNLIRGYNDCIKKLKAMRIPAGPIWAAVKEKNEACWKSLYVKDGRHPGKLGAYANSLAFFSVLLNKALKDFNTDIQDKKLNPEHVKLVYDTVQEALKENRK